MDERNNDFDFDFTPIGQAIKKARTARGMTREQLSRIVMLCINIFAWNFSSISLMLIAAVVSLTIFILNGAPDQKGGAGK